MKQNPFHFPAEQIYTAQGVAIITAMKDDRYFSVSGTPDVLSLELAQIILVGFLELHQGRLVEIVKSSDATDGISVGQWHHYQFQVKEAPPRE